MVILSTWPPDISLSYGSSVGGTEAVRLPRGKSKLAEERCTVQGSLTYEPLESGRGEEAPVTRHVLCDDKGRRQGLDCFPGHATGGDGRAWPRREPSRKPPSTGDHATGEAFSCPQPSRPYPAPAVSIAICDIEDTCVLEPCCGA